MNRFIVTGLFVAWASVSAVAAPPCFYPNFDGFLCECGDVECEPGCAAGTCFVMNVTCTPKRLLGYAANGYSTVSLVDEPCYALYECKPVNPLQDCSVDNYCVRGQFVGFSSVTKPNYKFSDPGCE